MANTRTVVSPGVFVNSALTTIPPSPVAGVAYRDPAITVGTVNGGWPYALPVESAAANEILFRMSSMLAIMDVQGILGWNNTLNYAIGAVVMGSDGAAYQATQANGPSTTVKDPVSEPFVWQNFGTAPTGSSLLSYASWIPGGYLACNGQAVSRTTYARLFAIIGTTYGVGDGSTTFNVPDARGRFLRPVDGGAGRDPGRVLGSVQAMDIQAHTHTVYRTAGADQSTNAYGSNTDSGTGYETASTGGTETRPINIALNSYIKT